METKNSQRLKFLRYVKRQFKPKFIYYPACGADTLPKKVLGDYHVIHLSLPERKGEGDYLSKLGSGIKLIGFMEHSPLADESVDAIWLKLAGIELNQEAVDDFDRVLKPGGVVAIEGGDYCYSDREKWNRFSRWFFNYKQFPLPEEFKPNQLKFGVRKIDKADKDSGRYVESESEMLDFIATHPDYDGFQEILDYAVFKKS